VVLFFVASLGGQRHTYGEVKLAALAELTLDQMRPPIKSTSLAEIESPSSEPPVRRAVAASACPTGAKTVGWSSGEMPTPVSCTRNSKHASRSLLDRTATRTAISPWCVNLMAYDQIREHLPHAQRIAHQLVGHLIGNVVEQLQPFS